MRPATTRALCVVGALAVAAASVAALRIMVHLLHPAPLHRDLVHDGCSNKQEQHLVEFGSDRSSCVSLFLAGRIHDAKRELRVMEMFPGKEICQVLGASSL
jgi:hypothetical protein